MKFGAIVARSLIVVLIKAVCWSKIQLDQAILQVRGTKSQEELRVSAAGSIFVILEGNLRMRMWSVQPLQGDTSLDRISSIAHS